MKNILPNLRRWLPAAIISAAIFGSLGIYGIVQYISYARTSSTVQEAILIGIMALGCGVAALVLGIASTFAFTPPLSRQRISLALLLNLLVGIPPLIILVWSSSASIYLFLLAAALSIVYGIMLIWLFLRSLDKKRCEKPDITEIENAARSQNDEIVSGTKQTALVKRKHISYRVLAVLAVIFLFVGYYICNFIDLKVRENQLNDYETYADLYYSVFLESEWISRKAAHEAKNIVVNFERTRLESETQQKILARCASLYAKEAVSGTSELLEPENFAQSWSSYYIVLLPVEFDKKNEPFIPFFKCYTHYKNDNAGNRIAEPRMELEIVSFKLEQKRWVPQSHNYAHRENRFESGGAMQITSGIGDYYSLDFSQPDEREYAAIKAVLASAEPQGWSVEECVENADSLHFVSNDMFSIEAASPWFVSRIYTNQIYFSRSHSGGNHAHYVNFSASWSDQTTQNPSETDMLQLASNGLWGDALGKSAVELLYINGLPAAREVLKDEYQHKIRVIIAGVRATYQLEYDCFLMPDADNTVYLKEFEDLTASFKEK